MNRKSKNKNKNNYRNLTNNNHNNDIYNFNIKFIHQFLFFNSNFLFFLGIIKTF